MKKDTKYKVIEDIIDIIKRTSLTEHTELYEVMPVLSNTDLLKLVDEVGIDDYQSLLVSMAIVYVNIGMLYARHNLNEHELENFRIWFQVDHDKETYDDCGFFMVNVCFTRDFKRCFSTCQLQKIQLKDYKLYPMLSRVNGFDSFSCFEQQFISADNEPITYYHFIGQ